MAIFVNKRMIPTKNIGSSPEMIFSSNYTCVLEGILFANLVDGPININLYILREVSEGGGTPVATEFTLANKVVLPANERVDILESATLTLEAGDLLFASSDYSQHIFNSFVSFNEFVELTGGTLNG